jgi:ribosomal protein L11 methyltransferase
MYLELSFDLGSLDPQAAEEAAFACGACAVTFVDARDDAVLGPAAGELRLWPATRVKCLFTQEQDLPGLPGALGAALALDPALIGAQRIADRAWEREWLRDFHALRFGRRLWIRPHHERLSAPGAVVVALDPGLAFGTGTHASTALCLEWLDAHFCGPPAAAEHSVEARSQRLDAHFCGPPAAAEHSVEARSQRLDAHFCGPPAAAGPCVIDYGCGSGVLALAAVKLGARAAHCFDIDAQALIATADNARANGIGSQVHVHEHPATLPVRADLLLANILAAPLCALVSCFAALLRPGGEVVLAGLMAHEAADVTEAYAACFDVVPFGERDGWVGLAGRRR